MNYTDSITILHRFAQRRRYFDPSKREDLSALKYFKTHHKWEVACPFYLEWPHADILTMCDAKYSEYMLRQVK
jgi:uncharacterized protein (DUF1684 family)